MRSLILVVLILGLVHSVCAESVHERQFKQKLEELKKIPVPTMEPGLNRSFVRCMKNELKNVTFCADTIVKYAQYLLDVYLAKASYDLAFEQVTEAFHSSQKARLDQIKGAIITTSPEALPGQEENWKRRWQEREKRQRPSTDDLPQEEGSEPKPKP